MLPSHRSVFAFLALAIIAVIALLGPGIVSATRIGLEFRGGYEVLYLAAPKPPATGLDKATLVSTAEMLGSRANALGVAEPEVAIESGDRIRVKLAGVTDAGAATRARAALADPARGLRVSVVFPASDAQRPTEGAGPRAALNPTASPGRSSIG